VVRTEEESPGQLHEVQYESKGHDRLLTVREEGLHLMVQPAGENPCQGVQLEEAPGQPPAAKPEGGNRLHGVQLEGENLGQLHAVQ